VTPAPQRRSQDKVHRAITTLFTEKNTVFAPAEHRFTLV